MMKKLLFLIFTSLSLYANAQVYDDYVGAGHSQGVTVTTSSNANTTQGNNTADGSGLGTDLAGASRFLGQASFGTDFEIIEEVGNMGISNWLDQQLLLPPEVSFLDTTEMIWNHFVQEYIDMYGAGQVEGNDDILLFGAYWRMAYWNNILKSNDIVRQRVALALSEIFVISQQSELDLTCYGLADYYDLLYKNAFGNYRDLLYDITLHPSMGYYLSHLNNPKSDPANNVHPDENYAREIMQLFSIGLYELNQDGTRKLDNGEYIATYDNDDIKEYAKIFTGFAPQEYYWVWDAAVANIPVEWGSGLNVPVIMNMTLPMQVMDEWHETGEKHLLNNMTVPAGQTGVEDINDAIDNLFNHDNVGPFIGRLLIQRLVKSNPTPAYIERVAQVFNDNGQGERGDLGAVVRAILMDAEARDCAWLNDATAGKLREPFVRAVHLLKAFNATNDSGKLYGFGYLVDEVSKQHVLSSPSVFNFFLPDFQPNGVIADANMVAPEFQLHTSTASIDYLNFLYDSFLGDFYLLVSTTSSMEDIGFPNTDFDITPDEDWVRLDLSDENALAIDNNPTELIERLDIILTGGQLSENAKETILNTINLFQVEPELMVKAALYLIMLSPDYNIRK